MVKKKSSNSGDAGDDQLRAQDVLGLNDDVEEASDTGVLVRKGRNSPRLSNISLCCVDFRKTLSW
jgi:hypothetical protein